MGYTKLTYWLLRTIPNGIFQMLLLLLPLVCKNVGEWMDNSGRKGRDE